MKTQVIILIAIGLLSLNSCNQKTDPNAMLENSETRTELFNTITSNHDYMTEFMKNMRGNNHAMQMMQGQGMKIMMKDSMMMMNMMKDGNMMVKMMKMMHKKGMMSEDCMQSCMNMMEEKGMNMQNMDTSTKDDHSEHH